MSSLTSSSKIFSGLEVVITFIKCSGKPQFFSSFTNFIALRGDNSDGFNINGVPEIIDGKILWADNINGRLNGVIPNPNLRGFLKTS